MIPKICCSGLAIVVLLVTGCKNDTLLSEDVNGQKTDPVLVEYPVVYIERDLVTSSVDNDQAFARFSAQNPVIFNPGASLIVKDNAFVNSNSINITADLFLNDPNGNNGSAVENVDNRIDIRDLTVSDDGQSFLVSIRAPEIANVDDNEQPKWNIWLYQLATKTLSRVISSDVTAEQGDDLMASFLPDGRIIFSSTRQRLSRAILLDEGKPQYTGLNERIDTSAFNIHVMDADGTNIKQLTFNLSHDLYPLILQNGYILYSRWDAMGGDQGINLYQMRPDGTENQLIYGWHSHEITIADQVYPIDFVKPQQLPNGEVFMLLASQDELAYQKMPIIINMKDYIDENQSTTPDDTQGTATKNVFPETSYQFNFTDSLSTSGNVSYLFPLPDSSERYLVSIDLCRVIDAGVIKSCGQLSPEALADENIISAPPWYELWLYDNKNNTQQLVATTLEGKMITEAIVMQASDQASEFIADKIIGNDLSTLLANEQAGAIHIRSVYDFSGQDITISESNLQGINTLKDPLLTPASALPARFLRVIRGVPMPPDEVRELSNTDFGRSNNQLMREIIGYTPIQPDGSVKVKIPANVPVAISVLDANGQRIGGRHRQWITVKAGETLECNGCHSADNTLPHGRLNAQEYSINSGAVDGGVAFPNASEQIIPQFGQTMAQADEMVNGLAQLSANIQYTDIWTNTALSAVNPTINLNYENLKTPIPTGYNCFDNWTAYCRIQINYVEHIQPLWQLNRPVVDANTGELLADNICSSCHSPLDSNNLAQVPAGQLDLSATPSTDQIAHLTAYRELFFPDVEQEVVDGILINKLVELLDENGNVVYERDIEGNLILDANGNPIPVLTTVPVNNILSPNSARSSRRFFEVMTDIQHQDMLSKDELKLLREWLDIGAQYYNTPFYQQN